MRDSAPLTAVVRRIRRALAEKDIPFDKKRFPPHITLIRKASEDLPEIAPEPVSVTVDTISLMRSDRGRNGMIDTELGPLEADRDTNKSISTVRTIGEIRLFGRLTLDPKALLLRYNAVVIQKNDERKRRK